MYEPAYTPGVAEILHVLINNTSVYQHVKSVLGDKRSFFLAELCIFIFILSTENRKTSPSLCTKFSAS